MTKITRAVGKQKVTDLAPNNTNRLITEAVLRELLYDLWDSSALQIDEEIYFNARELEDRVYAKSECMVYNDGNGLAIYSAKADGTNGIPFLATDWEKLTGNEQLQDLQSVMTQGGNYYNGSNAFVIEQNQNQIQSKIEIPATATSFSLNAVVPQAGGSFSTGVGGTSFSAGASAGFSMKANFTDVIYSAVTNTNGTDIGFNLGSGNGMYIGNDFGTIQNKQATATLDVDGSFRLRTLPEATDDKVLTVDANGNVRKRDFPAGGNVPDLQNVCTVGSTFDLRSRSFMQIGYLNPANTPNNKDGYIDIRSFEGFQGKFEVFSRTTDDVGVVENYNFFRVNGAGSSSSEYYFVNSREVVGEKSRSSLRMDGSNGYTSISQNSIQISEKDVGISLYKENENEFGFAMVSRSISTYAPQNVREYDEILRVEGELYISNAKSFFGQDVSKLRIEQLEEDTNLTKVLVYDEATGLVKKADKSAGGSSYTFEKGITENNGIVKFGGFVDQSDWDESTNRNNVGIWSTTDPAENSIPHDFGIGYDPNEGFNDNIFQTEKAFRSFYVVTDPQGRSDQAQDIGDATPYNLIMSRANGDGSASAFNSDPAYARLTTWQDTDTALPTGRADIKVAHDKDINNQIGYAYIDLSIINSAGIKGTMQMYQNPANGNIETLFKDTKVHIDTVSRNDSNTKILSVNTTTNEVEYVDKSSIGGGGGSNPLFAIFYGYSGELTANTIINPPEGKVGWDVSMGTGVSMTNYKLTSVSMTIKNFITNDNSGQVGVELRYITADGSSSGAVTSSSGTLLKETLVTLPNTGGIQKFYFAEGFDLSSENIIIPQGSMVFAVVKRGTVQSAQGMVLNVIVEKQ